MSETHASRRKANKTAGRIIAHLRQHQPSPQTMASVKSVLDLNKTSYLRALDRLVEIGAIHVDREHRLITLLDASDGVDEPEPPGAQPIRIDDPERLHVAILDRAAAMVRTFNRSGAVMLLEHAAARTHGIVAINFAILADLYATGRDRYPDVPREESEHLRQQSGYLTGAAIHDALASER